MSSSRRPPLRRPLRPELDTSVLSSLFELSPSPGAPNMLVAGKTMATSFLTNSVTRLHPNAWASGTAAGVAAVMMSALNLSSTQMAADANVSKLQDRLRSLGQSRAESFPTLPSHSPQRSTANSFLMLTLHPPRYWGGTGFGLQHGPLKLPHHSAWPFASSTHSYFSSSSGVITPSTCTSISIHPQEHPSEISRRDDL